MLFDTHAHVNFSAFKEDAQSTIQRALDQGVSVINVGTQIDTSRAAVEMAEWCEQLTISARGGSASGGNNSQLTGKVFAVIGIHPVHTYQQMLDEEESHFQTRAEKFDHDLYYQLAQNPKVVGIGECGLDYYRLPKEMNEELGIMSQEEIKHTQKETFIAQIRLAKELNKALVIHCRPSVGTQDAYEDILKILDAEGVADLPFEIHSFTGTPETAQEFLKRGAYVGLNGIITFDKTGNMQKVLEVLPLDRILLETDSPYLTPLPHRGKRNEPSYVRFVAEHIAKLKKIALSEVAQITTANASRLFGL